MIRLEVEFRLLANGFAQVFRDFVARSSGTRHTRGRSVAREPRGLRDVRAAQELVADGNQSANSL